MTIILFIIAFVVAALVSFLFVKLGASGLFIDDAKGVQKYHHKKTPRIGGIAIFSGMLVGGLFMPEKDFIKDMFLLVMFGALPIFLGGVIEDYTKKTSPWFRLLLAFCSTAMVFFILDVQLRSVRIPFFDAALAFTAVSFLFTLFAVSGLTNSINIIDGYNGLAGVVSLLIIASLLVISLKFYDFFLIDVCVLALGAIVGFLVWNYPYGFIFLGDSGAYFLGFIIAVVSIILINDHPQVSPWFPFLLCIYPVWETIFSMLRRRILLKKPMTQADSLHLHSLIHRRVLGGGYFAPADVVQATLRNSMTSIYLWMLSLFAIVPALVFWNKTLFLGFFALGYIALYLWLYTRIIRFKTPRCLFIKKD